MSLDDFYGRPLSKGYSALEFDLCEVCQRKSPQWLEVHFNDAVPLVRFTCDTCHFEYQNQVKPNAEEFYTRNIQEGEEAKETAVREGWVDEFISESETAGTIKPIESTSETSDISFSEAPSSFQEQHTTETPEMDAPKLAPWISKYIQEALFGPDPVQWLEEQGAFQESALELTLSTLESFTTHDNPSVKVSTVQCLKGLQTRHPSHTDRIKGILQQFAEDEEAVVKDFAEQTLKQIK